MPSLFYNLFYFAIVLDLQKSLGDQAENFHISYTKFSLYEPSPNTLFFKIPYMNYI